MILLVLTAKSKTQATFYHYYCSDKSYSFPV